MLCFYLIFTGIRDWTPPHEYVLGMKKELAPNLFVLSYLIKNILRLKIKVNKVPVNFVLSHKMDLIKNILRLKIKVIKVPVNFVLSHKMDLIKKYFGFGTLLPKLENVGHVLRVEVRVRRIIDLT